MNMAAAYWL